MMRVCMCVRVRDDVYVYVCACAGVLGSVLLFCFCFVLGLLLFFYVRRPHCKLDLYICTILLMIYVLMYLLSNCVTFVNLSYYLILSYLLGVVCCCS